MGDETLDAPALTRRSSSYAWEAGGERPEQTPGEACGTTTSDALTGSDPQGTKRAGVTTAELSAGWDAGMGAEAGAVGKASEISQHAATPFECAGTDLSLWPQHSWDGAGAATAHSGMAQEKAKAAKTNILVTLPLTGML